MDGLKYAYFWGLEAKKWEGFKEKKMGRFQRRFKEKIGRFKETIGWGGLKVDLKKRYGKV